MSKFDENLFGRIAVLNNYVTKKELGECLALRKTSEGSDHIGKILLDRGYLDADQYNRILEIRKKKVRRLLRSQEDAVQNDREFGKIVLQENLLEIEQLEGAVLEQQQLKRLNIHFNLAEVLVSKKQLKVKDVQRVFARQGRSMLRCSLCDLHYQVVDLQEGEKYSCPKCQSELDPPAFLDPLMVEGVVGDCERASPEMKSTPDLTH